MLKHWHASDNRLLSMISIISIGYDGYIHVKIFSGWGKKFGKICTTYQRFPCINYPNLIELSTFVLQNHLFVTFVPFSNCSNLSAFLGVKVLLECFAP